MLPSCRLSPFPKIRLPSPDHSTTSMRRGTTSDFQKTEPSAACLPEDRSLKFERADWTLFRTVEGLQQKAGVPKEQLRKWSRPISSLSC
jgi:hypothetical protein